MKVVSDFLLDFLVEWCKILPSERNRRIFYRMKNDCPFPDNIRKIGICTPSKRVEPEQITAAVALLEKWGIAYTLAPDVMTAGEEDYFAANAEKRAAAFNALLRDESIDLILCSRGGYGAAYLLPLIDWDLLKKRNLPVIGYSDVTALHLAMLARSAGRPVAARMAAHLPDIAADPFSCDSMRHALAGTPEKTVQLSPVIPSVISSVTGGFVPVNLTVLASLCGSQWLPDWSGMILALEDIDEEPRKIDRMLLQLDLAGIVLQMCEGCLAHHTQTDKTTGNLEFFRIFHIRDVLGEDFCAGQETIHLDPVGLDPGFFQFLFLGKTLRKNVVLLLLFLCCFCSCGFIELFCTHDPFFPSVSVLWYLLQNQLSF